MTRDDLWLLWTRHRKASLVFLLAAAVTAFFVIRIAVSAVYWAGHHEEPIQAWMTVGYIGHSWELSPREIDTRAGLPSPEAGHPFTLKEVAVKTGVPVADIIAKVQAVVGEMRAEAAADHGDKLP